ncbi:hypothetical protein A2625_08000 [candidate division WOR-1 bacterium RIFCSPHIGHO2_01_FULL_53_15]|uniref:DUF5723 domain-containing protein n=1 Tax=candidate division WOR-1 bacterium RIFCSPHIGHO2_01_FULL_53_15 TaxID=1802564 RepID=A0A1F4Q054_UNCSA|nr:MAG: hypothetical protein A2625_08000 [candidate division WOR-1 bacterium RIFCSPHIGHO2_01_FULL_53_15]OGC12649.1 MAG: hypothetical protein A3D23_02780 [candidate division WOR-1 bacterium RIFCSPHIGHO2_02_FULL_53_26]
MFRKLLVLFLLLAVVSQNAFALFGARPMGMGGAFTAIADDANAPYWNPAGIALNPEVSLTGSTMINNRNTFVGDNVGNLKMSYETEMNPFQWIAGVGLASMFALEGAKYLSDQGILKKGWGRAGEATAREESMAEQVKGTEEVVSLRQEAKKAVKAALWDLPWDLPWYRPHRHYYWEPRVSQAATKAQFALGVSWLNDYNPPLNQGTNWYTLTLASGFEQRVAVGGGVNFYNLQKISTGIRGIGADVDLGAIAKPVDYISFGIVTKGILTTDIAWQDGSSTRYEMLVNAGLAVKPIYSLTLAADVHNLFRTNQTYHYGAEAVLLPGLLGRAGISDGSKTVGLSLAVGNIIIDYALLGGIYNRSQMIGAAWRF